MVEKKKESIIIRIGVREGVNAKAVEEGIRRSSKSSTHPIKVDVWKAR